MNEWESFALILVVIYLSECLAWIPVGSSAFHAPWRGQSRLLRHGAFLANRRGSLLLQNPLPPLGQLFLCQDWPMSVSPWGLSSGGTEVTVADISSARCWKYEDIQSVEADGRSLRLNGQEFARCASAAICRNLAGIIDQLRRHDTAKRPALIERHLRQAHNVRQARRQLRLVRARTLPLRIACNGLFCYFFTTLYLWIRVYVMFTRWQMALAGLVGFLAVISALLFSLHRHLYRWNRAQRWTHAIVAAVSPMAAIRAVDHVERDALSQFSPLAVAAVISAPEAFQELARRTLAELTFRDGPRTADPELERIRSWYQTRLRSTAADLMKGQRLDADALLAPPLPSGTNCRSYCPLCHAQYSTLEGTCVDCGDVALRAFGDA